MLDTANSGAELVIKHAPQLGNYVLQEKDERTPKELPSTAISPEEWAIINLVMYAPKDPSLIRQVLQNNKTSANLGDKILAKRLVSLGEKLLVKKKFKKAGRLFNAAKTMDPSLVDAYINLAETYIQRNNYENAIKTLKSAIRSNPNNLDLLKYSIGLAEYEGDSTRLTYFYRLMLNANPQDPRTYINLVQLLMDHAKFEQIVEITESIPFPIMDQRDKFRMFNMLVNAYDEMKRYDKALSYADSALQIKPKRIALWEAKANMYRKLGQNEAALKCLKEMCRIKPHAKKYNEDAYLFGKKHQLL